VKKDERQLRGGLLVKMSGGLFLNCLRSNPFSFPLGFGGVSLLSGVQLPVPGGELWAGVKLKTRNLKGRATCPFRIPRTGGAVSEAVKTTEGS